MLACILRTIARPRTRNKGWAGGTHGCGFMPCLWAWRWLWLAVLPGWSAGWSAYPFSPIYGKALRWSGLWSVRPNNGLCLFAIGLRLTTSNRSRSSTSGRRPTPKAGTFPQSVDASWRLVPRVMARLAPCLSGCYLVSHWHGSLYPGPRLRVRGRPVVRNIWASLGSGCCLIVHQAQPLLVLAWSLAIQQPRQPS